MRGKKSGPGCGRVKVAGCKAGMGVPDLTGLGGSGGRVLDSGVVFVFPHCDRQTDRQKETGMTSKDGPVRVLGRTAASSLLLVPACNSSSYS